MPSGHTPKATPPGQGMAVRQFSVTSDQLCPQNLLSGSSPSTGGKVGCLVGIGVGSTGVAPTSSTLLHGVSAMHLKPSGHTPDASPYGQAIASLQCVTTHCQSRPQKYVPSETDVGLPVGFGVGSGVCSS
jgi:hypothetical protein